MEGASHKRAALGEAEGGDAKRANVGEWAAVDFAPLTTGDFSAWVFDEASGWCSSPCGNWNYNAASYTFFHCASGGYYQTRLVGNVVQGRLETVAACGDGSEGGSPCPDTVDDRRKANAGWNLHPGRPALAPKALPKLDAEVELGAEDTDWLHACLADSRYPQNTGAVR